MISAARYIQSAINILTTRHWHSRIALFVSVLIILSPSCLALPTLKQVHVITRHGSRHPLTKDAQTLEEETSEKSALTPLGQQQHYQLGVWLRERYENELGNVLSEYSPSQVYMESSAFERTLVSAQSLALGLFPATTRGLQLIPDTPPTIPVYTHARHNDINIRAYDKCPAFLDNLEQLYNSKTFDVMEVDAMPLLRRLARIPAFEPYTQNKDGAYVPLQNLWNVYDAIHVAKTECTNPNSPSKVCQTLPDPSLATSISEEDWMEIQEVAHAVELLKYGPNVAKNMLGGTLWSTILERINNGLDENRFYLTSAHYPTLLGLFAALGVPFQSLDKVIPEYASALILEVYQAEQSGEASVKMFYKSGMAVSASAIQLSETCRTDLGCSLPTFANQMEDKIMTNDYWCLACHNTDADVCIQQEFWALKQTCSSNTTATSNTNNNLLAALFFAGMLTTLMVLMVLNTFCCRRPNHQGYNNDDGKLNLDNMPNGDNNGHHHMNGNHPSYSEPQMA